MRKIKFFTWCLTLVSVLFAWLLPQSVELSRLLSPASASAALYNVISMSEWMISFFPRGWPLLLYVLLSLLFFFIGYRFVLKQNRVLKWILLPIPLLLFSGLFAVFFFAVQSQYEIKYIEHEHRGVSNPLGEQLQEKVDAMRDLVDQYRTPCWLSELGVSKARQAGLQVFDVNSYFTVLTNLSIANGYVVDYVHIKGANGLPVIYARRDSEPQVHSFEELGHRYPEIDEMDQGIFREEWGKAIRISSTPTGYLEYAALYLIGEQFYLLWHANYNDRVIIASSEKLEKVINSADDFDKTMPEDCRREATKLDVRPKVEIGTDVVTVDMLTFSKWGGFSRYTLNISRNPPHRILSEEKVSLVQYDCGVMY